MTPYAFFLDLRTWLRGLVWTGTTNKIFGDNVYIVPTFPMQQLARLQAPTCFIADLGASINPIHPQLLDQNFSIAIWLSNVQSEWGEGSILSACRTVNTSLGAGLLQIENELLPQIYKNTAFSSTKIMIVEKAKTRLELTQNNFPLVSRVWTFSCLLSFV